MKQDFDFFKTEMPESRKADFYLSCLEGSVFIDFNKTSDNLISLIRISFDGFGCCELVETKKVLNFEMSKQFILELEKVNLDQESLTHLIKEIIKINKDFIWTDALEKYNLIDK